MNVFNIDKSVTITVDLEAKEELRAENGRFLLFLLGEARYREVLGAVKFLTKETAAVSATLECGLTVYRGRA